MSHRHWLSAVLLLPALYAPRAAAQVESWQINVTDVITGVVPLGALALTYAKDDAAGRRQYLWSMGTSLVIVNGARLAFNQHEWGERPNGHPYGFPSGHLAFLGAGAAFLQDRYGWKWGVPAWAGTAYMAWVRVEDDHHHWRDILVATAVVVGASQYFVTPFPDTTVTPLFGIGDADTAGLQLEYRFAGR